MMAAYNDVNGVAGDRAGPRQQRDRQGRVGLRRADHVRLVRHQDRRPRPRTAASTWSCPARTGRGATRWSPPSESGEVAESVVDDHLRRLLRLADRVGALGRPRAAARATCRPRTARSAREQLTRLAAAGMTVLTNDGAVLPLDRAARVALIGRHARRHHRHGRRLGPGQPAVPGQRRRGPDRAARRRGHGHRRRRGADPAGAGRGRRSSPTRDTGEPGVRLTLFDARRRRDRRTGTVDRRARAGRLRRRLPETVGARPVCGRGRSVAGAGRARRARRGDWELRVDGAVSCARRWSPPAAGSARSCWPRRRAVGTYPTATIGRARPRRCGPTATRRCRSAGLFGLVARPARRDRRRGDRRGGRGGRGPRTSPSSWSG